MSRPIIFHIDVNSAYLSWEAAYHLQKGHALDMRTIPSAVGGDISKRRGIILAKSIPAKKYGIKTGESLTEALKKCPSLKIVTPNYNLYLQCSNAMVEILKQFSPAIERYSVDECFLDYSHMDYHFGSPIQAAQHIKTKIQKELGFTVNIGISTNKLLAKMASDFQKPNLVHTLFPEEIQEKMWPLSVKELFMVGRATTPKLFKLGIYTIGDLALANPDFLYKHLKSHGLVIWNYANGKDTSLVTTHSQDIKGLGNSTTIPFDVEDSKTAKLILLSLTETVAMRLRESNFLTSLVSISIKSNKFSSYSHQRKLTFPTDGTTYIHKIICELFDEIWDGEPIRQLGIRIAHLSSNKEIQLNLFDFAQKEKFKNLDASIDHIRNKYGSNSIIRASFLNSSIEPLSGGMPVEDYPIMSSLL
jgi:DNA polymerase-4